VVHFFGRVDALTGLSAAYHEVVGPTGSRSPRLPGLVLVAGEAGMGKTTLLARFAADVTERGGRSAWGTCWDGDQAPAFWPWTQALRSLLEDDPHTPTTPDLAVVLPDLATPTLAATGRRDDESAARLRVFDSVGRFLGRAAAHAPVVVILDDLQWSDQSTLDLLRYLSKVTVAGPVLLVGSYRPDELPTEVASALAMTAQLLTLRGLAQAEVSELVAAIAGEDLAAKWAPQVHERSGGHPFFARELCQVLASGGAVAGVPAAVREVIARRLSRVTAPCARMLEVASVAGPVLLVDVLAEVAGVRPAHAADLIREGTAASLITGTRFTHDLYRESIYASLSPGQRLDLHHRVGLALVRRRERGAAVFPAELARQFAAAVPVAGPGPALTWARLAADAEQARYAFAEAAGHLGRARSAIAEAGASFDEADLVDLLAAEAEARMRAGETAAPRQLLDTAWVRACQLADPGRMGAIALGLDALGARFAMPRAELVDVLDQARQSLADTATPVEALVTAALARQLQHSVAKDRPRARPLAERAVAIARNLNDPRTLASSLLAHHDTIWTPGTAAERIAIAGEISQLANRTNDLERYSQGLLLTATAQLESGSPAFRVALAEYEHVTAQLRQPRHDYLRKTRQAALALLDGDIDAGERLSAEAATLGEAVGDTDTGNVRMSQRLEVVRAHGDPVRLREFATQAVRWWVGAPAHAHAVAAGFLARAGDLDGARRELDTVLALPDWRADRSYLWSVFVGELATAAIALDDRPLCARLLKDLVPIADTCGVNGALVCFVGAHSLRVGQLHAAIGQVTPARYWLGRALATHRGLGARAWEAETCAALAGLGGDDADQHATRAVALAAELGLASLAARIGSPDPAARPVGAGATLALVGELWYAVYAGRTAYLANAKGLHDLAALLGRPGVDVPALELAGAMTYTGSANDPVLDRAALLDYRRRLRELDDDLAAARERNDLAFAQRANVEREQVLDELRRATRPGGASRKLGPTAAERARKAVTARIRDAIRRIDKVFPELGTHLDRTIRTGTTCRYDPGQPSR
jgi:hypothetical protein